MAVKGVFKAYKNGENERGRNSTTNGEGAKQVFRWHGRGGYWTLNLQLAVGKLPSFEKTADTERARVR